MNDEDDPLKQLYFCWGREYSGNDKIILTHNMPAAPRWGRPAGRLARRCWRAETGMNTEEENEELGDVIRGDEEGMEGALAVVTCCRLNGGLRELCSSGVAPASGMLKAETWDLYQFSR